MYFTSKLAHALLKMCPQCNIYSFSHMRTLAFDYDHLEVRFQALSHPFQTDIPHKALVGSVELTTPSWGDEGESYLIQHPAIKKDQDFSFSG